MSVREGTGSNVIFEGGRRRMVQTFQLLCEHVKFCQGMNWNF